MTIPVMPIMGPLIRYAAVKTVGRIGPYEAAIFTTAFLYKPTRGFILDVTWGFVRETARYTWKIHKVVGTALYRHMIVPTATEIATVVNPWYVSATRAGTASGASVIGGVAFFAIAFPLAMATTDQASYGDLYTQEIAEYEHSALGQGSGMGIVI
jgi:hypothetical protein